LTGRAALWIVNAAAISTQTVLRVAEASEVISAVIVGYTRFSAGILRASLRAGEDLSATFTTGTL
jgi:hypothetical protein